MLWNSANLEKYQRDRVAHAQVRIQVDPIMADLHVADRHGEIKLAASCLLLQGFQRSLAKDRELELTHRALHAEQ